MIFLQNFACTSKYENISKMYTPPPSRAISKIANASTAAKIDKTLAECCRSLLKASALSAKQALDITRATHLWYYPTPFVISSLTAKNEQRLNISVLPLNLTDVCTFYLRIDIDRVHNGKAGSFRVHHYRHRSHPVYRISNKTVCICKFENIGNAQLYNSHDTIGHPHPTQSCWDKHICSMVPQELASTRSNNWHEHRDCQLVPEVAAAGTDGFDTETQKKENKLASWCHKICNPHIHLRHWGNHCHRRTLNDYLNIRRLSKGTMAQRNCLYEELKRQRSAQLHLQPLGQDSPVRHRTPIFGLPHPWDDQFDHGEIQRLPRSKVIALGILISERITDSKPNPVTKALCMDGKSSFQLVQYIMPKQGSTAMPRGLSFEFRTRIRLTSWVLLSALSVKDLLRTTTYPHWLIPSQMAESATQTPFSHICSGHFSSNTTSSPSSEESSGPQSTTPSLTQDNCIHLPVLKQVHTGSRYHSKNTDPGNGKPPKVVY
uniref:Uncharacterized protein n=1 Tax=Glossina austeni TaxID=7395 RepID=A0A1A9UR32_GLOAU